MLTIMRCCTASRRTVPVPVRRRHAKMCALCVDRCPVCIRQTMASGSMSTLQPADWDALLASLVGDDDNGDIDQSHQACLSSLQLLQEVMEEMHASASGTIQKRATPARCSWPCAGVGQSKSLALGWAQFGQFERDPQKAHRKGAGSTQKQYLSIRSVICRLLLRCVCFVAGP